MKALSVSIGILSLAVVSTVLAAPGTAHAAAYVKFDGVDGEATDKDHKNWSDLASFSQGLTLSSGGAAGVRRRGSAVLENILLAKELDKSSPKLAEALLQGKVFPKVEIHVTASLTDAGRVTYYRYELKNVLVVSYKVSGSGQSDQGPTEEIALSFEEIKVTYTEFDAMGKKKGNVEYTWKVAEVAK